MDLALSSTFTKPQLRSINLCRLHFNALTLSNITNATGTQLLPGITDRTILLNQSRPKGPAVKQPSPGPQSWTAWQKVLRTIINLHGILHAPRCLGSWTVSGPALSRSWPYIYLPTQNLLFRPQNTNFEELTSVHTSIFSFEPSATSPCLPDDATPVNCVERSDIWYITALS